MRERRYKIYLMNNKSYDADEADIEKLRAHAGEMLVQLKQVMVHPASITAIEPYFEDPIRKINQATMAVENHPPKPLPDLFADEPLKIT